MTHDGKRRFNDASGVEWWAYETRSDPPIDGVDRVLIFYSPEKQRRERLPWPDGLNGLHALSLTQLCALLPLAESLPEPAPDGWQGERGVRR